MNVPETGRCLVFTDLDGSLLDHHTYSYRDAVPQLRRLEYLQIPVILASSKTRAEIEHLRGELGNRHPFISENGAAVFIPRGYFDSQPEGTLEKDDYWVRELSAGRSQWLDVLDSLRSLYPGEYQYFYQAGIDGIVQMTNLPEARAREANQREYSEPVKWLGSEQRKQEFLDSLCLRGASVLQGGRFLTVSGDCDKGRALTWLRDVYLQGQPQASIGDLAIGDSANDLAMLEAASAALVVRSPVHDFPTLNRAAGVHYSRDYGPAGWAEGVTRWLEDRHLHN